MRTILPTWQFLLGCLLLLTACKKEEPTTRERLVGPRWQTVALYREVKGELEFDTYASRPACLNDDFWQFRAGDTFVRNEGALQCYASNPQEHPGTWQLSADETQLTWAEETWQTTEKWTIVELSATHLTLKLPVSGVDTYVVRKLQAL